MWNLVTNRPIETRRNPIIWTTTTHPAEDSPPMEIVYNKELIVTPVVSVLSSSNAAPKPPKKRFLEAAAAAQQKQEEVKAGQEKKAGTAADNSALMQLAEMCVYYQKSGQPASWKRDSPVYTLSPANTPFWGWSNRSPTDHHAMTTDNLNEDEPLDLSGEETIRTNQQELIDHLVEKLCARPLSGSIKSALVQPKLSLLTAATKVEADVVLLGQQPTNLYSSSEVSSSSPPIKTDTIRKDLPLKKRDSSLGLLVVVQPDSTGSSSSPSPLSSCGDDGQSTTTAVSSTNGTSKKPAPRSCKGKRYLEFMYEGRISVLGTSRVGSTKRTDLEATTMDLTTTTSTTTLVPCDQSTNILPAGVGRKKRGPSSNQSGNGGHQRNKVRKIS